MSERAGSVPAAYWELTKPRLSFLSVLTALAGYFCSEPTQATDAKVLVSLAIGTALAAGGCGAINMWWDSEADAKMERTRNRPLVTGLIAPVDLPNDWVDSLRRLARDDAFAQLLDQQG